MKSAKIAVGTRIYVAELQAQPLSESLFKSLKCVYSCRKERFTAYNAELRPKLSFRLYN